VVADVGFPASVSSFWGPGLVTAAQWPTKRSVPDTHANREDLRIDEE
jgi:hypothetical protein